MTREDAIKSKEEFLESIKDLSEEEKKQKIDEYNKEIQKLLDQIDGSIKVLESEVKKELLNKPDKLTKEEQIDLGKAILKCSNNNLEVIDLSEKYPEMDAVYLCIKERGGNAIIVNSDKEYLTATSSVDFDRHLQEFINGRRTDK